jgi:hypothetical protein
MLCANTTSTSPHTWWVVFLQAFALIDVDLALPRHDSLVACLGCCESDSLNTANSPAQLLILIILCVISFDELRSILENKVPKDYRPVITSFFAELAVS